MACQEILDPKVPLAQRVKKETEVDMELWGQMDTEETMESLVFEAHLEFR